MKRRGWTLHEMAISLGVMGGVLVIAAHVATGHLRFFRSIGESAALARQVGQTSAIVAAVVSHVSSGGGDILVAMDSAIEVRAPIGTALTCAGQAGRLTIPAAAAHMGNVLAAFSELPEPGDVVHALFEDSLGTTWLTLHVASTVSLASGCAHFPSVASVWNLELREPLAIPGGAALRFTRPIRFSLYRGSDSRWYLGARDWNGVTGLFNTIQPVAGPLRPYSADPDSTGLLFVYRDARGELLAPPSDPTRIASITITSRAAATRREQSTVLTVALRNTR